MTLRLGGFGALLIAMAAGALLVPAMAGATPEHGHAKIATATRHAKTPKAPKLPKPPEWTVAAAPAGLPGQPIDPNVHALIGASAMAASPHAAVIAIGSVDGPSLGPGGYILIGVREPSGPFAVGHDALTCMTQAVYFEARSESQEGQEAVAQVVMNRTHLRQYPSQVCDVVFQGADRATGCQFSFVCNGVLGPPTETDAWRRAGAVAERALSGFVYEPLKDATHFHATWVTPYWSSSLTKLKKIGGHIFYR